jgi:hypothetical protein
MKFFSFGFTLTLSFLLMLAMVTLHLAYFPTPEGPEKPEYPTRDSVYPYTVESQSTGTFSLFQAPQQRMMPAIPAQELTPVDASGSANEAILNTQLSPDTYQSDMEQYERDMEQYEKDQEEFIKDEMVPYIKNVIIRHLLVLIVLEILALLFVKYVSVTLGAAYAMGGFFGVFFATFGSVFIFPYMILSAFASNLSGGEKSDLIDIPSILSAIGWTSFAGVIVISIIVIFLFDGMLRFWPRSTTQQQLPPPEVR